MLVSNMTTTNCYRGSKNNAEDTKDTTIVSNMTTKTCKKAKSAKKGTTVPSK